MQHFINTMMIDIPVGQNRV